MQTKIALFQFNPCVGDIAANTDAIINAAQTAKTKGAHILLTPELALSGAVCKDLYFEKTFWQQIQQGLDKIEALDDIAIVVGHPSTDKSNYYNSASIFLNGNRLGIYHKMLLSSESAINETRYFTAGLCPVVFELNQTLFSIIIGEDANELDPAAEAKEAGAQILLGLNASAFYLNRQAERLTQWRYRLEENQIPGISVNMVGGQDELVFDGQSFALNADGSLAYQAAAFDESLDIIEVSNQNNQTVTIQSQLLPEKPSEHTMLYQAVVLATRDYIHKSGFSKICLGLSGGIDSALVLAVAADAIGAENCEVIIMPTRYTASISVTDAETMAKNMGVKYSIIDINPLFEQFKTDLSARFSGLSEDITEENLQARIRGTLLMALSNKTGALLLNTGNKSELATGYCTLYGDMNGGFAVIKDLLKTQVYALSRYRNTISPIIPERIIVRPPSAELREDQKDQDSLPEYEILDAIIVQIMEYNASKSELIQAGFDATIVDRIFHLIKISEYKRTQGAIGPKVSRRCFGSDWQMPVCHRFVEKSK